MSFEQKFLEIYSVLVDEGLDEFYSSDIAPEVNFEAGAVGKAVYDVIENYDVPMDVERQSPAEPSVFTVEEFLPYSEIESMLDTSESYDNTWERLFDDVRNRLDGSYEDSDLDQILRDTAENYYDNFGDRMQGIVKVKTKLQEKEIIEGDTIDGWTVKDS